jgi:hypothetical protein
MVFPTLATGAALPGDAACAARVQRSSWEPRPQNDQANHQVPTDQQLAQLTPWGPEIGLASQADSLRQRITGNFTGTTDEIFQWASCKWGIDTNILRAEAIQESNWLQSNTGDQTNQQNLCPPGAWDGSSCAQSYGILQIKYIYNQSTWPMSRDDTAFNVDYVYAYIRSCYEGWITYLYQRTPLPGYPTYHRGDIWGCLGVWYSGSWYDQYAVSYIRNVQMYLASKEWLNW